MNIAQQLKYHRQLKGLTQEDVANKLNVYTSLVNRWETGKSSPSLNEALKLSELLDTTLGDLVKGKIPLEFPFDVGFMYTRKRLFRHFFSNFIFYLFLSIIVATSLTYLENPVSFSAGFLLSLGVLTLFYLFVVFPNNQFFSNWRITQDGFQILDITYIKQIKSFFLVLFKGNNLSLYTFIPWHEVDHVEIKFRKFLMNPKRDYSLRFVPLQAPVFVKHNSEPFYFMIVTKQKTYLGDMVMDYKRRAGHAYFYLPEIKDWLDLKNVVFNDPLGFVEHSKQGVLVYDFVYDKEDQRAKELNKQYK